jgi:hypothetical protein
LHFVAVGRNRRSHVEGPWRRVIAFGPRDDA